MEWPCVDGYIVQHPGNDDRAPAAERVQERDEGVRPPPDKVEVGRLDIARTS